MCQLALRHPVVYIMSSAGFSCNKRDPVDPVTLLYTLILARVYHKHKIPPVYSLFENEPPFVQARNSCIRNSRIIKPDALVSLSLVNISVKVSLELIRGFRLDIST